MKGKDKFFYEAPATTVIEVKTESHICIISPMYVILGMEAAISPSDDAVQNYIASAD